MQGDELIEWPNKITFREPKKGPNPGKREVRWNGSKIEKCQLCGNIIKNEFVDGASVHGPWAIMCLRCSFDQGKGIGTGLGQRYRRQHDGSWLKMEG